MKCCASRDPEHVLSRGFACIKGVRYDEVQRRPDRLLTPQKRVECDGGHALRAISWEQALSEIGAKVRSLHARYGRGSCGMYVGNPAGFGLLHALFAPAFAAALQSRHLYTAGSQDCNNKFVVSEEMFGSPYLHYPIAITRS